MWGVVFLSALEALRFIFEALTKKGFSGFITKALLIEGFFLSGVFIVGFDDYIIFFA